MEIMLVVMIIALLASLAIYKMGDLFGDAQVKKARADLNGFKVALISYRGNTGNYPTTEQGLQALVKAPEPKPPTWRKIMDDLEHDPWGNAYAYERPGQKHPDSYDVFSLGPDGQRGTDDDIYFK
jgi:general secretion pathway protein G